MLDRVPIFTIGYGAREIDAFIAALQQQHIEFLIDVRSRPYSRYKPDFSRDALEGHLRRAGIRYVFLGDSLGGRPADESRHRGIDMQVAAAGRVLDRQHAAFAGQPGGQQVVGQKTAGPGRGGGDCSRVRHGRHGGELMRSRGPRDRHARRLGDMQRIGLESALCWQTPSVSIAEPVA